MGLKRLLLVAVAIASVAGPASAQLRRPRAELTPLVESEGVRAGGPVRLALRVSLPEGVHTQSNKPRDPLLIPTVLTFDPPPGVTVDELVWPPSTDFVVAGQGQPLAVFEHEFPIGVRLTLSPNLAAGDLVVPAHLRFQACNAELCFPPTTTDTQWTLRVVAPGAPVAASHREVFDKIPFGHGEAPGPARPVPAPQIATPDTGNSVAQLEKFELLSTTGGYLRSAAFLDFIHKAERGIKEKGMFEGRGPLAILLIVFAGGLALNLTPCVLPMIPINLAIIGAGARAGSRKRGFLLGSAYGAAMAMVYGALGLVVILTAGTFGTINASPWFNAAIATLFVVLGLAMFDVLLIDFSSYSSRFGAGGAASGSFLLAFSMGAVAALLAGACVAPVVIQVVLFSSSLYAAGTRIALALPFFLGIGMAVPWPIAGAGLAALPKPGLWMVRVKQAFGVVILATAAYYGYEAYQLFSNRWVNASDVTASVEEKLKEGWTPSLAGGLAAAEREGKPVLIDMWATWCKNCLTMDKTTLASDEVRRALSGYVKIKYQAEDPDAEPARSVLQRLSSPGLPAYAILKPKAAGAAFPAGMGQRFN